MILREGEGAALDRRVELEARRHQPAGRDRAGDARHLERGGEQHALAYRHLREVAGIPALAVRAQLPLRVRHHAGVVDAEVDAGLSAEAELARGGDDRVGAGLHAEVAEIRVAALHHGVAHVEGAVSPAARAPEAHVAEGEDPCAFVDGVRRHAERKRRERDDRLEGGPGRIGAAAAAAILSGSG